MKVNIKYLSVFAGALIIGSIVFAQHFWHGETMSITEAKKKWGNEVFDPKQFKSGNIDVRAKMAASLAADKRYIGKSPLNIREDLGDPDGYYFSDVFPAYLIQEGKNNKEESWQIVFLLDRGRKIEKTIIHKNCCSK
jgi:hypothetical protein